jgi:acetate kinase
MQEDDALPSIPVAISARHVHLTVETVAKLFGEAHGLHVSTPLLQPGQFAAAETVTLVGPRGRLEHVRVVGPERSADQVEISRSDEFLLGIEAPVRESGRLAGTPGVRLEGPAGAVELEHGVICAQRHIHMSPADADVLGLADGDTVDVAV